MPEKVSGSFRYFARNFFVKKLPILWHLHPVFPQPRKMYHTFRMYFSPRYPTVFQEKFFLCNFFTCIGTISLKNIAEILFRTFCCVFLLFRIRTPGAFAKLHNGNLQHFPRKCPRRENAKAMKLCVQAIYIYFPFLIPQRYIWVKKKALSGNVIKLSKSAHTKKSPPRLFEVGFFFAFVMWIACAYFAGRTMTCPS